MTEILALLQNIVVLATCSSVSHLRNRNGNFASPDTVAMHPYMSSVWYAIKARDGICPSGCSRKIIRKKHATPLFPHKSGRMNQVASTSQQRIRQALAQLASLVYLATSAAKHYAIMRCIIKVWNQKFTLKPASSVIWLPGQVATFL